VAELPAVTRDPIDAGRLLAAVASPACGGTALFLGTVRAGPDDGPVVRIEYEAYAEMLETEFLRIAAETTARWAEARVAVQHRIGPIPLGEPSIAVAVAAPHRAEAFAACRFAVDEAKRRLPVWKREVLADGTAQWRDNAGGRTPSRPSEPSGA
jgi:molybdopterin synthase catalytic subunit